MSLADFGDIFGHGGVYDRFFTENLDKLVDKSQRPWSWREGSVHPSAAVLPQFERAERIRQMFFSPGAKVPEVNFVVRLSNLDPTATRFYVNIDGQKLETRPGVESRSPVVWPGPEKGGFAFFTFEDRTAAPEQAKGFQGPWAWFRLIDATTMPHVQGQPDADLDSVLRVQTKYHQAQVTVEGSNAANNPAAASDWRQFKCEP
jgi:type VI secretion system protein ImpL